MSYHNAALASNKTGLPIATDTTPSDHHQPFGPADLTRGGRVIYQRTRRSPSYCNAVAALIGIGGQER